MRIYFVGSHATGKTTMTRWVSRRYELPMITEVARSVLAELETNFDTLRTDMERVGDYQRRVFERQIATERLQEKGFVSDRAFDNLAYNAAAMSVGGVEARHAAVLNGVLKADQFPTKAFHTTTGAVAVGTGL